MRIEIFAFFLVYFILIILVNLLFSRRMKSLEDFFLASRSLSAPLVYFSLCASWFGATSILVTTDEAYLRGVASFWLVGMPAVLTVLILGLILVRAIYNLSIVTLPDLVELRYGHAARHLASLLIFWYMVVFVASQMVAIGQFLKTFLYLSYFWSLILGTGIVLLYSVFGGLFSVVITESFRFFLISAGILGLSVFLLRTSPLQGIRPLALALGRTQYFDFFFDFKKNFLTTLSFTLAWTISPIAWQRIKAASTAQEAKKGLLSAAGTFVLLYGLVVSIGILSLPLLPSGKLGGPLLSELILSKTGIFLGGILFIAVLAAIMSTMDSAINTGALTLTRDVYEQIFQSRKSLGVVAVGRFSTLIVGALAFLVATKFQSILKTIGLASEIMAEGLFIPGIAMIFLKKKMPLAGLLSLVLGGGFSLASFFSATGLLPFHLPVWPFSLPYGLALSLGGFALGLALEYLKRDIKK
jgi:SSS family solute:Na+ symporter